jgi:hypothetical protein
MALGQRVIAHPSLLVAVLVVLLAGCGKPTGSVSGTVRYQGQPVEGTIVFLPADGSDYREASEAPIQQGHYDLRSVPVGKKTIGLTGSIPGPDQKPAYLSLDVTANRTLDLHEGSQTLDLELGTPSTK